MKVSRSNQDLASAAATASANTITQKYLLNATQELEKKVTTLDTGSLALQQQANKVSAAARQIKSGGGQDLGKSLTKVETTLLLSSPKSTLMEGIERAEKAEKAYEGEVRTAVNSTVLSELPKLVAESKGALRKLTAAVAPIPILSPPCPR